MLLIATFLGVNVLILSGIASVLSYMNTGADKSSMLHLEAPMDKVYAPKITWGKLDNPGRPMEKQTLLEIERDYLSAWHVRNIAYYKNDYYGIADFYTDSARSRLYEQIDLNLKSKNWYKATTLEHHPDLDFYSEDGTLVVFTDLGVERYQEAYRADTLLLQQKDTVSYQVLMLLEDGFWRIRHMKQLDSKHLNGHKSTRNVDSMLNLVPGIKGINYYPQKSPWDTFGKNFNDTIISNDFEIIKNMGLNTLRIFEQYEDFGKSQVKPEKLQRLKTTLDLADAHGLKVMITLFDFYGDYDVSNWTLTLKHAEIIVNTFKDHPALLGWDVKNEPDLDFESRGKLRVITWLEQMLIKIKQWDSRHPVTIGWSSPEAAVHLSNEVDFVSYHYYREPNDFIAAHETLKSNVPSKHILLQEYGLSSYNGLWNLYQGSEKAQVDYYSNMQSQLGDAKIPFILWTLYDFDNVPSSVAGRLPWRTRKQGYFGCIDSKGRKKPVFKILSN
ncbi:MAG: cellulase family glycosylhydrolase [Flavobacteriaceae bacterium]